MPRKSKPTHYNGGIIRATPYGTHRAEINHGAQRIRRSFPTLLEARAWIDITQIALHNETIPLTAAQMRDAATALQIAPDGVSLSETARYYTQTHTSASMTVQAAIAAFLRDKERAGLRERSLSTLKHRLGNVSAEFGPTNLDALTTETLAAWFDRVGFQGVNRKNYRKELGSLFNWAIKRGHLTRNPALGITIPRMDERLPEFLTVEQTQTLFRTAERTATGLIPYLALAAFAGLRRAELERMDASAITIEGIRVTAQAAKLRQQRWVTLLPTLAKWWTAYPPTGPITGPNVRRELDRLIDAAGIRPWPQNALRHSFATYHLAWTQDAAKTAHELGHASSDMLFRHYRGLATQEQARRYFEILPENTPKEKAQNAQKMSRKS